jgi:long-chain acyl-CoA synthetase
MSNSTILHRLASWAESDPKSTAQTYLKSGKWLPISAQEYCDRVYWLALYFEASGMNKQDVATIYSYNCPEWVHVDLAAVLLGARSSGIYPNSVPKDVNYILNHTETRYLAVQNADYYHKIVGEQGTLPQSIKLILVFDEDTSFSPLAVSYQSALAEGKKLAKEKGVKTLRKFLDQLDPDAPAFMIYTSGTTGDPKGALISNDNLVYAIDCVIKQWRLPMAKGSLFSFLPLCHIAETFYSIACGITQRYNVYFCSKFERVGQELPQVQPTLILCVPRVWEKMMEGVLRKIDHARGPQKLLAQWALGVGARTAKGRLFGGAYPLRDRLEWMVADRLVISKIRKALGLGRAEALASGAASLPIHVCRWFRSIGLEIVECFGQTETTALVCLTDRGVDSLGTAGKPVQGTEVKIADDGEILTRGRHIFVGYFKNDRATAEVLQGGWLHTGDLGEFDKNGLIKILGRKKEILKTSGGKMVAPLPIEEALKASPIISQVCMVGDGRKFLSALITLSEAKLEKIVRKKGTSALKDVVITDEEVLSEDKLNATLSGYQQIKSFAVLSKEFSVESHEMTATLKMKRNVIESHYQAVIDHMYKVADLEKHQEAV